MLEVPKIGNLNRQNLFDSCLIESLNVFKQATYVSIF